MGQKAGGGRLCLVIIAVVVVELDAADLLPWEGEAAAARARAAWLGSCFFFFFGGGGGGAVEYEVRRGREVELEKGKG